MEGLNPQSAGETENSFRQSQTILGDLKHHKFAQKTLFLLGAADRSLSLLFTRPATIRHHCQR
jgi:hypothetical protein